MLTELWCCPECSRLYPDKGTCKFCDKGLAPVRKVSLSEKIISTDGKIFKEGSKNPTL